LFDDSNSTGYYGALAGLFLCDELLRELEYNKKGPFSFSENRKVYFHLLFIFFLKAITKFKNDPLLKVLTGSLKYLNEFVNSRLTALPRLLKIFFAKNYGIFFRSNYSAHSF
jgi:hypothetical protein